MKDSRVIDTLIALLLVFIVVQILIALIGRI